MDKIESKKFDDVSGGNFGEGRSIYELRSDGKFNGFVVYDNG